MPDPKPQTPHSVQRHGPVRLTPAGSPIIHTAAWLAHRTRGVHQALTEDLHRWGRRHRPSTRPDDVRTTPAWADLTRAWCTERRHTITPTGLIVHQRTRLDADVWILPATTPDDRRIAVVGINHHPPTVYADGCPDPWAWRDADSLIITCPAGHTWTWRTGRELLTATGKATTLTAVFGPRLDAPFTPCTNCAARDDGRAGCSCDRNTWIVCPTCGLVCTLTLPTP